MQRHRTGLGEDPEIITASLFVLHRYLKISISVLLTWLTNFVACTNAASPLMAPLTKVFTKPSEKFLFIAVE